MPLRLLLSLGGLLYTVHRSLEGMAVTICLLLSVGSIDTSTTFLLRNRLAFLEHMGLGFVLDSLSGQESRCLVGSVSIYIFLDLMNDRTGHEGCDL